MRVVRTQDPVRARPAGLAPLDDALLRWVVVGRGPLSAPERVETYARLYVARLVEVLRADHPAVLAFLGERAFFTLAEAYLREHPHTDPDITRAGCFLPAFLRRLPGMRPDLGELAQLEWERAQAGLAPDAGPPATPEALRTLLPEALAGARFTFVPALRQVDLLHDVAPLWDALLDRRSPPDLVPGPTSIAVWRQGARVFHAVLERQEAAALRIALGGGRLEDVCVAFDGALQPAEATFAVLLSWFADGWVAGILPPDREP